MEKETESLPSGLCHELWLPTIKIRGLGELFGMSCGDPPLSEEAHRGISHFLINIADELESLRKRP